MLSATLEMEVDEFLQRVPYASRIAPGVHQRRLACRGRSPTCPPCVWAGHLVSSAGLSGRCPVQTLEAHEADNLG